MFSISNFVIFPQMVLGYPREIVTVYGRGTLHSCGPTKLDKNKEYFLYGILFISNTILKKYIIKCVKHKLCSSFFKALAIIMLFMQLKHVKIKLLINTNWKKKELNHCSASFNFSILKNGFMNEFAVSVNDTTTNKPIINQFHEASFANITRVNSYVCSCTVITNQLHST